MVQPPADSADDQPGFTTLGRLKARLLSPVGLATTAVLVLLVAAAVALWPWASWSPTNPCHGVSRTFDGHCVGVSGSSDFGDPALRAVMGAIDAENRSVTGDSYMVGYLVPLEPVGEQTGLSAELRHELQGALIAQLRANRTSELGGGPKVRIVVGNGGPGNVDWSSVTSDFIDLSQSGERLRAVVGLGTSLETTERAIAELTRKDDGHESIAAIAARLTADDLSLDPTTAADPGLFRVAPRNIDEVAAGVDYIRSLPALRPLLVSDRLTSDGYVNSLGRGFRELYGPTAEASYDSSQDGLANAMDSIVKNICGGTYQPDVVYFAGRGDALSTFVDLLADRSCPRLTIVTGDDISGVRDKAVGGAVATRVALQRHVIVYAGLAHPALARVPTLTTAISAAAMSHFTQNCPTCSPTLFPADNLTDGAAMMGHDAVALAVNAIRQASVRPGGQGGTVEVSSSAVIQLLYQTNQLDAVSGATGRIAVDSCGEAVAKLFPLLTFGPTGVPTVISGQFARAPSSCGG